ncbi:MAG: hypothetical protein P8012_05210 [Desulfobacterales bacterium]
MNVWAIADSALLNDFFLAKARRWTIKMSIRQRPLFLSFETIVYHKIVSKNSDATHPVNDKKTDQKYIPSIYYVILLEWRWNTIGTNFV